MALSSQDLIDAGKLSVAAYGGPGQTLSAQDAVADAGWTYVDPGGYINRIDNGFYSYLGAQALVARSGNTWAIAIRGTTNIPDFLSNAYLGLVDFGQLYQVTLADFVSAIIDVARSSGASKILIVGHSLGGAMTEYALVNELDPDIVGVTFGSPGIRYLGGSRADDDRLYNLGHLGDPVFNIVPFDRQVGNDIRIDLPDEPDLNLPQLVASWRLLGDVGEHDAVLYSLTANLISREIARHGIEVSDYTFVIGTDPTKSFLYGTTRDNVIIGDDGSDQLWGYGGDDVLDGFGGNDELRGGGGNDTLDGGTGADTAVFELPFDNYNISLIEGKVIVSPKSWAFQFEGTDTVWDSVEFFMFSDGTKTWAEVQPVADGVAPTLSNRSPSDNATAVSTTENIVLAFDEDVVPGTGFFEIRNANGSLYQRIAFSDSSQISFVGDTVTINPLVELAAGSNYYITIDNTAILDWAGNAYAGISSPTAYNFSTIPAADTAPPILMRATSADNTVDVAVGADFVLYFNEIITPGVGTVSIFKSDGTLAQSFTINDSSQVAFGGNAIVIDPGSDLDPSTGYYFTITPGAIRDLNGNPFSGFSTRTEFNFTTESTSYVPPAPQDDIFISIFDNSVRENQDGGSTTLSLGVVVTGAGAGTRTISVQYSTEDIFGSGSGATAGVDYVAATDVLTIPAGQTSGVINITLIGDAQIEPDEVFRLVLSSPSSRVTLKDSSGQASATIFATGFILNDDSEPNRYPVTLYDIGITGPSTPIIIDVLGNDSDPEGGALTVSQIFNLPSGAAFELLADNRVLVTPDPGFDGILSFGYVARDMEGAEINGFAQVIISGDGSAGIVDPGTLGADIIGGAGGNDILSGGYGDDIIAGGAGSDRIDGGPGFDFLDLRAADHGANIQFRDPWIWDDGDFGRDIISNIEGILGSAFDDTIDGSSASIEYLTTGYRFYGNDGDDSLRSDAGDDLLDGGAGNDTLIFGAGRDTAMGGAGDDLIYSFSGASDIIGDLLDGGDGNDSVYGSLGASADTLLGGRGSDQLQFSNGDIVSGGAGADIFRFGGFSNTEIYQAFIIDISLGEEIHWNFPNGISGTSGPITPGDGSATGQSRVEYSVGPNSTILYIGYDLAPGADFILTISGVYSLSQLQFDDSNFSNLRITLQGGSENDLIVGGLPDNSNYVGGGGLDTIDYSDTRLGVSINLLSNIVTGIEIGVDQLNSIENAITGFGNDTITGSSAANILIGGAGDDSIQGDAGNDSLNGGLGFDTLRGGNGDDSLSGGEDADILFGSVGRDTLRGDGGADKLFGGGGNDKLIGGGGNDSLYGNANADIMRGGVGDDAFRGYGGNDRLFGDDGADSLLGHTGNDIINGGNQGDILDAGTGNDQLFGDSGNDTLFGRDGVDTLKGGGGGDVIFGGKGSDRITGGSGNDTLAGNGGNDFFIYAPGDDADTITDFAAGAGSLDVIDLSAMGAAFDTFAEILAATTTVAGNAVIDFGGGDTITLTGVIKVQLHANDFIFGP
jgi:Ca2+-binding RTX toxin-like protein